MVRNSATSVQSDVLCVLADVKLADHEALFAIHLCACQPAAAMVIQQAQLAAELAATLLSTSCLQVWRRSPPLPRALPLLPVPPPAPSRPSARVLAAAAADCCWIELTIALFLALFCVHLRNRTGGGPRAGRTRRAAAWGAMR